MYAVFEKAVCDMQLKKQNELDLSNSRLTNYNINTETSDVMNCKKSVDNLDRIGWNRLKNECTKLDNNKTSINNLNIGYECLQDKVIYQDPDLHNTYHNYLVPNGDDDKTCVKNHQCFNNWTRRTFGRQINQEINTDMGIFETEKIPIVEPKICKLPNPKEMSSIC